MHIIDRYLLWQYMQNFLICFLSLMGLYIVIEVSTNLDTFVSCGKKCDGVIPLIAHYYAYKSLLFFDLTAGQLAMISAMFTLAWLQRHNEMTALLAAGVPRMRVLQPIIIAAVVVILLAAANRELLIPRYRNEVTRPPQDPIGDRPQSLDACYDSQTDIRIGGKNTYADQKRISEPEFTMPLTLRDYGKQVTAENAYYLAPEGNRPSGYLLDNVHEPKNLDTRPSLSWNNRPVLITPRDAPGWLKSNQCFLVSNLDFAQLSGGPEMRKLASTMQMIIGLRNPSQDFGAKERVAIHSRIVHPFLDITLLFLGLPLIITRESRNMFIAMGMCMLVTTVFSLVVLGMQVLGENSVIRGPALAAWAPLIIFVPLAVAFADSLWS